MTKLEETKKQQKELLDGLKEFLYTNRGRTTTKQSDDNVLLLAEKLLILGYNEAFYELKGL